MKKTLSTLALSIVALAGCGGDEPPAPPPPKADAAALPAELFLAAAPEGARGVAEAKKDPKAGDEIVLRGRIGGIDDPFTNGRAIMTVADLEGMKYCGEAGEEDGCTKPWDYCCESPEAKLANTATVRVVGADGKPLAAGLEGAGGMKPLAVVVVKGKVSRIEGGNLVVDASGIYVER